MTTENPKELEPCLAEIKFISDLGTSTYYEVVYYDGNDWKAYSGSTTFSNGEVVLRWVYAKEAFVLKTCRDHWKSSYDELRKKTLKPTAVHLDKIIEFIKYEGGRGGWSPWVSPKMKGYKMQCCDCGLIHEIDFKVVKFKGKPDEKGLSECEDVNDKDIQILWRLRRSER